MVDVKSLDDVPTRVLDLLNIFLATNSIKNTVKKKRPTLARRSQLRLESFMK